MNDGKGCCLAGEEHLFHVSSCWVEIHTWGHLCLFSGCFLLALFLQWTTQISALELQVSKYKLLVATSSLFFTLHYCLCDSGTEDCPAGSLCFPCPGSIIEQHRTITEVYYICTLWRHRDCPQAQLPPKVQGELRSELWEPWSYAA